MNNYLYLLVRKDLPHTQKTVQASHITWEVCREHNLKSHPNVVFIGVKNEDFLLKQIHYLENRNFKVYKFNEPLLNNELTGIGVFVSKQEDQIHFKRYNLMKEFDYLSEIDQKHLLLKNCTHKKTKAGYIETLAFEFTPKKICSFCNETVGNLNDSEKVKLYKEYYKDIFETNPSEEEVLSKKNGFNL